MELTEEQIKKVVDAAELVSRSLDESMRADEEQNLHADAGTNDLKFPQVKEGRQMIMEHLVGYNDTSACTRIRVGYWNGHGYNWLNTQPAPLTTETVGIGVRVRLREGMWAVVRFEGCTALDDLHAALNGYWIKAR